MINTGNMGLNIRIEELVWNSESDNCRVYLEEENGEFFTIENITELYETGFYLSDYEGYALDINNVNAYLRRNYEIEVSYNQWRDLQEETESEWDCSDNAAFENFKDFIGFDIEFERMLWLEQNY